jgi:hypothetical protein
MHLTRNQAYLHGYRGFKSLSLRQKSPIKINSDSPTSSQIPNKIKQIYHTGGQLRGSAYSLRCAWRQPRNR